MSMPLIITLGIVGLFLIIIIAIYNSLVSLKNHIKDSWADIDVQMKRRYDLIPNLVNTVKGYASHEKEVLEKVSRKCSDGDISLDSSAIVIYGEK